MKYYSKQCTHKEPSNLPGRQGEDILSCMQCKQVYWSVFIVMLSTLGWVTKNTRMQTAQKTIGSRITSDSTRLLVFLVVINRCSLLDFNTAVKSQSLKVLSRQFKA